MLGGVLYQPPALYGGAPAVISPWSPCSIGTPLFAMAQASASGATVAANMVMFVPFWIPRPATITKLWWANGSGVAGNVDVGVYQPDGTLVISAGTTAQSGASAIQSVNVTDTAIARGLYYMALVGSTVTTQTFQRAAPAAALCQAFGILQQDISGTGLPLATNASPATFAKCTTAWVPLFGVQFDRTVGP